MDLMWFKYRSTRKASSVWNRLALTFTAHKFAGPRGIGGLLLRHGVAPDPMLFGGFQQTAIRPGTEDICLVMGLSVAVGKFVTNVQQYQNQLAVLRDDLQSQLEADLSNISINSGLVDRTPHFYWICLCEWF